MKKLSKFLSIVLALITVLTLAVPAFAVTSIDRIDISTSADIVGKCANDYKDLFTITTSHLSYSAYLDDPAARIYDGLTQLGNDEKMVAGKDYIITYFLVPDSGYKISGDVKVYVDGVETKITRNFGSWISITPVGDRTHIDRVDIATTDNLAGKCAWNYYDLSAILSSDVEYYVTGSAPGIAIYENSPYKELSYSDKMTFGKEYCIYYNYVAGNGYYFDNDTKLYVDGEEYYNPEIYGTNNTIAFSKIATPLSEDKLIKRVDINFDNKIAGKTAFDFKDYFTFSADNCSYFIDTTTEPSVEIYDEEGNCLDYDVVLNEGSKYEIDLCLVANKGYGFSPDVEVYVNGEKIDSEDMCFWLSTYDDIAGQDALAVYLFDVEAEASENIFYVIFNAISDLFFYFCGWVKDLIFDIMNVVK